MKHLLPQVLLICVLLSCSQSPDSEIERSEGIVFQSKADSMIQLSNTAHGTKVFNEKKFRFSFRYKVYSFDFRGKGFSFTRSDSVELQMIDDYYTDSEFYREINGEKVNLNEIDKARFSESINSVIYFATLPYKLLDNGVVSTYKGLQKIKLQNYNVVMIAFEQEGGGEDYQDVFYYWFNEKTHFIDYFAYEYETNGGGVRFREAINQIKVGGAVFQDYINYEVPVGTDLIDIPDLFEKGNLKELSIIENKYISIIPN